MTRSAWPRLLRGVEIYIKYSAVRSEWARHRWDVRDIEKEHWQKEIGIGYWAFWTCSHWQTERSSKGFELEWEVSSLLWLHCPSPLLSVTSGFPYVRLHNSTYYHQKLSLFGHSLNRYRRNPFGVECSSLLVGGRAGNKTHHTPAPMEIS